MKRAGFAAGAIVLALAAPLLAQQPQAGQTSEQAQASAAARRAAAFERLDTNHDGVLSQDEWSTGRQAGARALRQRKAEQVRQRVRRMDVNRDGAISRDEWRGNAATFDRLDADKDGRVTPAEVRAARRQSSPRTVR